MNPTDEELEAAEHHREWLTELEPVFQVQREARHIAETLQLYVAMALRSGTEPSRILEHLQLVKRAVLTTKNTKGETK